MDWIRLRFRALTRTDQKKRFIISLLVIISLGGVYFCYDRYYVKPDLKRARAYEGIGEYPKAVESYAKYLLKKPDDISAKIDLARALLKVQNRERATEILDGILKEVALGDNRTLKQGLSVTYREIADFYEEQGNKAMDDKDFELARTNFEKEAYYITKLLENNLYDIWEIDLFDKEDNNKRMGISKSQCIHRSFENIANSALTYWLEEDYDKANETISHIPFILSAEEFRRREKVRYLPFGYKLDEIGSEAFDKKEWKMARKHWEGALSNFEKNDSEASKSVIPSTIYNIAITYWNQKTFWKAKELLTKLQKEYPEHNPEKVKDLILEGNTAAFQKMGNDSAKEGRKAFDKADYTGARAHFREALKHFKKSGIKDNDGLLAEIRYNTAITYWNEKNWSRAKEYFLLIRKKHPKYQAEDVQDYLNELDVLLGDR